MIMRVFYLQAVVQAREAKLEQSLAQLPEESILLVKSFKLNLICLTGNSETRVIGRHTFGELDWLRSNNGGKENGKESSDLHF
jgi:hypothetical protein